MKRCIYTPGVGGGGEGGGRLNPFRKLKTLQRPKSRRPLWGPIKNFSEAERERRNSTPGARPARDANLEGAPIRERPKTSSGSIKKGKLWAVFLSPGQRNDYLFFRYKKWKTFPRPIQLLSSPSSLSLSLSFSLYKYILSLSFLPRLHSVGAFIKRMHDVYIFSRGEEIRQIFSVVRVCSCALCAIWLLTLAQSVCSCCIYIFL